MQNLLQHILACARARLLHATSRNAVGLAPGDARGAVFVEKLIVYLPLMLTFFLTWELAELGAAHLVVGRACAAAGRAAVVVLPDDPVYYDGESPHVYDGRRRDDVELAAGMVLSAIPRMSSDFEVDVSDPPKGVGQIEVTLTAPYACGPVSLVCGADGVVELTSTTAHTYQGAAYAYSSPAGMGSTTSALSAADEAEAGDADEDVELASTSHALSEGTGGYRKGGTGGGGGGGGGSGSKCDDCPPGADGLLTATGGGSVLNFSTAEKKSSREAKEGVYLGAKKVYKVYSSKDQAEKAAKEIKDAAAMDINVPKIKLSEGKKREGNSCKQVWILEMTRAKGDFFQLAKGGHSGSLLSKLKKEGNDGLRRSIRQLYTAYCRGVTDPQGFYKPGGTPPLTFIDIHTQSAGKTGSEELKSMADELNSYYGKETGLSPIPFTDCKSWK